MNLPRAALIVWLPSFEFSVPAQFMIAKGKAEWRPMSLDE